MNYTKQNGISFFIGFMFAIGLAISGMTQPQKVIGFLSLKNWDPSLMFVMLGAISVHMVAYRLIKNRRSPLFNSSWHIPKRKDITSRLMIGSALFGAGWGLGGFCPGPGITSLASLSIEAILFVICMLIGMILFKKTEPYLNLKE